jgi:hypothetical protein
MRTLLHDLADRPEPASAIDIAAARRSGKRRLWVQRGAISAAVAAVVTLAVAVPQALFSGTGSPAPGAPTIAPAASGTVSPKTAPRSFNPLVPYAAFGYVPKGYEFQPTGNPSSGNTPFGFTSSESELLLSVKQASGNGSIVLDVMSKGACGAPPDSLYLDEIPGYRESRAHNATSCNASVQIVGGSPLKPAVRAPEVDGRAAYWLQGPVHEAYLAWQYAPGSWATLEAYPLDVYSTAVPAQQAMLLRMAPTVKFGQTKPILFPFKLTSAIAANWQAAGVNYTVTPSGQYLATGLTEGQPYGAGAMGTGDLGPVTIATSRTCPTPVAVLSSATGPVNTVQENGVSWRVENANKGKVGGKVVQIGNTAEIACTVGLVNGLHTSVTLSQSSNSKPIINSILAKLTLRPSPQTWTTDPLPG